MPIEEVQPIHTPNAGRIIWNANDKALDARMAQIEQQLAAAQSMLSNLAAGDGAAVAAGPSMALSVKAKPFSAKGDDRSDDTPGIQAAIDACFAAGGGTVYFPPGVYLVSRPVVLKDLVSLTGAGMFASTLKLAGGANSTVLTDASVEQSGAYAFGRTLVADLGIDGNRDANPAGLDGIHTTAYYSTFERLYVRNCGRHGIHLGYEALSNQSSQDRITGCRVSQCGGAGIFLDIHSVDHTIAENYIHNCDTGLVIRNGGVRVVNNGIFGHTTAGILVEQTASGAIVAANDLNANKQHGIIVTRTTVEGTGQWGQVLIADNTILADGLMADGQYDGIHVDSEVPDGIALISIVANKVFGLDEQPRFQYGVNLVENITRCRCAANQISHISAAPYYVGPTCTAIELDTAGAGPLGAPALPQSGEALSNPFHAPVTVCVSGGVVSAIAIDGQTTGLIQGSIRLSALQTIAVFYTQAPAWKWFGE